MPLIAPAVSGSCRRTRARVHAFQTFQPGRCFWGYAFFNASGPCGVSNAPSSRHAATLSPSADDPSNLSSNGTARSGGELDHDPNDRCQLRRAERLQQQEYAIRCFCNLMFHEDGASTGPLRSPVLSCHRGRPAASRRRRLCRSRTWTHILPTTHERVAIARFLP